MPTKREPSRPGSSQSRRALLRSPRIFFALAFCCICFIFAVYSRSLDFQFALDDHRFIADARIQQSGHIWDYFTNFVWAQFTGGPPSFYRPVFLLWMRINFLLSAFSPWGWHLLSIAKHMVVAALLGMLAWKLLQDATFALVVATIFALHPAQTESVSWVTVPDPLMSAGLLGSLLCYLRYVDENARSAVQPLRKKVRKKDQNTGPRSIAWFAASLAAYFAALLTKETAIVFPAVIIALYLCAKPSVDSPDRPAHNANAGSSFSGVFRNLAPFICVTALYLGMRFKALGSTLDVATQHLSWNTVALSWPATFWFYLRVLLWPVRSYSFADPTVVDAFSWRGVLLPLLCVVCATLAVSGTVFWGWTKARRDLEPNQARGVKMAFASGILLLVLPLLLTLNLNALNPDDFLHGRYTYLPLAGLMLLVSAFFRIAGKLRPFLLIAGGVLAIAFAALTFAQEKQWKDDATLFTIAHELAPRNVLVARHLADTHVQAALKLDEEGRCSEAVPVFEKVASDYPEDWYAWAGLGDCYVQLSDLVKAEASLHRAADISRDSRVIAHWQELRAHMGLPTSAPANSNAR